MTKFVIKHKIPICFAVSGALTALPMVFTSLGLLQWVSLVPMALALMWLCEDGKTNIFKAYGMGVVFFWSYYAVTFHWFYAMFPMEEYAGIPDVPAFGIVTLGCFGLSFLQSLFSALSFVAFISIARIGFVKKRIFLLPLLMASLWVIAEWWQNFGWWGVPWGRLPLGQLNFTLLLRSASLFGSYFITFVIVAVNFFLAIAIVSKKARRLAFSAAICTFALNLAMGLGVTLAYDDSGEVVRVAAAQGNVSSTEKWSGKLSDVYKTYDTLTTQAAEDGADIVVWPETALPIVLVEKESYYNAVKNLADKNDVTILASVFTKDDYSQKDEAQKNSIMEIRSDGSVNDTVYSKQRLVPFGEFVPLREIVLAVFPPLGEINMLSSDLEAGSESVVIDGEKANIGCAVCFDSIYDKVLLDSVRNGAEMIAVSTNDSWFGDSAALYMHNGQSRLRAIESGRYVVRSANTGISSIIDPMGNVKEELGALEKGIVVSDIKLRNDRTLYSVIGNSFVYICIAYVAVLPLVELVLNIKKIRKNNLKIAKKD